MRALKILLVVLIAPVFAVGAVTIFKEVQARAAREASISIGHDAALRIFDGDRVVARIMRGPEPPQVLIQMFAPNGNQVDLTCRHDRITTSHMVTKADAIHYYFDRDGDGVPEMRTTKNPKTRESVPEYLVSSQWVSRRSTKN